MSKLKEVPIELIGPNPFRRFGKYPYIEEKIETLRRSLQDVGFWEGVVAREAHDGRYQIAFGHHRIEAARREGLKKVPLVIRALTDKEMLQLMSRENQEEYKPNFSIQLGTWEAAAEYLKGSSSDEPVQDQSCNDVKAIEIARFLGWTRTHGKHERENLSDMARACHAAQTYVMEGWVTKEELGKMPMKRVRIGTELCRAVEKEMEKARSCGGRFALTAEERRKLHEQVGSALKFQVQREVDETKIYARKRTDDDFRQDLKESIYQWANQPLPPEFDKFCTFAARSIEGFLENDKLAEKMTAIVKALPKIMTKREMQAAERIDYSLGELIKRIEKWRKKYERAAKRQSNAQGEKEKPTAQPESQEIVGLLEEPSE